MIVEKSKYWCYWQHNYYPGAAEEATALLRYLNLKNFVIKGRKGSHNADLYVFSEDEEKFKNEILGKTFIGQFRIISFGYSYDCFGNERLCYNVCYSSKK